MHTVSCFLAPVMLTVGAAPQHLSRTHSYCMSCSSAFVTHSCAPGMSYSLASVSHTCTHYMNCSSAAVTHTCYCMSCSLEPVTHTCALCMSCSLAPVTHACLLYELLLSTYHAHMRTISCSLLLSACHAHMLTVWAAPQHLSRRLSCSSAPVTRAWALAMSGEKHLSSRRGHVTTPPLTFFRGEAPTERQNMNKIERNRIE